MPIKTRTGEHDRKIQFSRISQFNCLDSGLVHISASVFAASGISILYFAVLTAADHCCFSFF